MMALVKAAYLDRELSRQLNPGETVEMTRERFGEIAEALPGVLEEVEEEAANEETEEQGA